jgi:Xaa-Pro aminopeptidase
VSKSFPKGSPIELFGAAFDSAAPADAVALRAYRRDRVRDALLGHDLAAIVLFNPVNIRYACDARNMQVYGLHNPCRYLCMTADGHATLFEFRNCEHLSRHLETVHEIRPAKAWYHMAAGPRAEDAARAFAEEIAALVRERGGADANRVAFDRLDLAGAAALGAAGLMPVDGLALLDFARAVKSADEIKGMCEAIRACEEGLRRMQAAHRPGISEQALWSVLCHANAELGGEWMETRLLSAGQRTNPWYNECGDYLIQPGDLVSFDTDLVGRHGYSVDISRSWLTEGAAATDEQRQLYALAHAQIHHNIDVLKPGRTFREIADAAYRLPERFVPRMNRAIAHGIGLCNEYPLVVNREYFAGAYDGVLTEGMVLCVESYVGEPGGKDGVKLEEQVLITAQGAVKLSAFPFDDALL